MGGVGQATATAHIEENAVLEFMDCVGDDCIDEEAASLLEVALPCGSLIAICML